MLDIYHRAAPRLPADALPEVVQVYGGVGTAHRLLPTDKVQDGSPSYSCLAASI